MIDPGPTGRWFVEYGEEDKNGEMGGASRAFVDYGNACAWARQQTLEGYVMYVWYPSEHLVDRDVWMAAE